MRKYFLAIAFLGCGSFGVKAQEASATPNQILPYDYQFYQKLNPAVYHTKGKFHSSIKAFYTDGDALKSSFDSLMAVNDRESESKSWGRRKLFAEHLIQIEKDDYKLYADFLPDFQIGKEFESGKTTWLNTRGFQVGGNVGEQFSFYLNGFENQAKFADYVNNFVVENRVVPGQGVGKLDLEEQDWAYVSTLLSYTPNKYLNFALGYDKNFIGDGYRSMLLSDVSSNYSFFRLRASLGDLQYQTIYAYMLDPGAPKLTNNRKLGDRGKWMAAHYLDWNATNRLSIGLFQAVTWADAEVEGKRGFDFSYVHPFVFLRPIESNNTTSPDKMRIGLNVKYEVLKKTALYGQFMLDELRAKEFFSSQGSWTNKWALQLGLRGADLFTVPRLNYLAEYNTARPYTYAHFDRVSNYANYNQPLAHPFGANFREYLGILNYGVNRFDFQIQGLAATYGIDDAGSNYGKDIFKDYETRNAEYGNYIGQGLATTLHSFQGKVVYMLNPKYNLRLELGGVLRQEKNNLKTDKTAMVTFGLRSSFRNLYYDF